MMLCNKMPIIGSLQVFFLNQPVSITLKSNQYIRIKSFLSSIFSQEKQPQLEPGPVFCWALRQICQLKLHEHAL